MSVSDLHELIDGERSHLKLGRILPSDLSAQIAVATERVGFGEYLTAPNLGRLGFSYTEAREKDMAERYFAEARTLEERIDSSLGGLPNPFRVIRNLLHERWEWGVEIASHGGKAFACGIVRRHLAGWKGESCHIDDARSLVLEAIGSPSHVQISAVYYPQVARRGGHLQIWSRVRMGRIEYLRAAKAAGVKYLTSRHLGPPDVDLRVSAGECVVFRTDHPHTVSSVEEGSRISFAFFAATRGAGFPLVVWA